jgi:hypothetical protein
VRTSRILSFFAAALAVACGDNSPPTSTAIISGAIDATVTVWATGIDNPGSVAFGFYEPNDVLHPQPTSYPSFEFAINFVSTSLQTGTFNNSSANLDPYGAYGEVQASANGPSWEQSTNRGAGTFSLTISSVGPRSGANRALWNSPHGTFIAILAPAMGNPSTANVTVNVNF